MCTRILFIFLFNNLIHHVFLFLFEFRTDDGTVFFLFRSFVWFVLSAIVDTIVCKREGSTMDKKKKQKFHFCNKIRTDRRRRRCPHRFVGRHFIAHNMDVCMSMANTSHSTTSENKNQNKQCQWRWRRLRRRSQLTIFGLAPNLVSFKPTTKHRLMTWHKT